MKALSRFLLFVLSLALLLSTPALAAKADSLPDVSGILDGLPLDDVDSILSSLDVSKLKEALDSLNAKGAAEGMKELLRSTGALSDEELCDSIRQVAEENGIPLNDSQIEQLADLCRHYETLDELALQEKLQQLHELRDHLSKLQDTAQGLLQKLEPAVHFLGRCLQRVGDFLLGLAD